MTAVRDDVFVYRMKDEVLDGFREEVASALRHRDLTAAALSRRIGWAQCRVSNLLVGGPRFDNPTLMTMSFLAAGLDMSLVVDLAERG